MSGASEAELRASIVAAARSLHGRSLTHGSTGNISVRLGERILLTPTGSSLGTVEPGELSVIGLDGTPISGPKPSKEAFLHAAVLRSRPQDAAVVHTHSTFSVAVSCLAEVDPENVLPPLTAYYAMRVGTLRLLPYHAPGDASLEPLAEAAAREHHAFLLANHGPVVSGATLAGAVDALEELEQTARLFVLLAGQRTRPLTAEQAAALRP